MKRRARTLPVATLCLVLMIVAAFAVEVAGDGQALCARFGLVPARPSFGAALSGVFVHDPGNLFHVGGNLAVLVLVGSRVERAIGSLRFAAIYFAGGVAGAAMHIVVDPTSAVPLVGASGSLFAVLAVAATLFGAPMLAFVAVLVATNVAHAFGAPGDAGVSFGDHLGGFVLGVLVVVLGEAARRRPARRRRRLSRSRAAGSRWPEHIAGRLEPRSPARTSRAPSFDTHQRERGHAGGARGCGFGESNASRARARSTSPAALATL